MQLKNSGAPSPPLATTPPTTNDAIPAGWRLVPIEPTKAMIKAWFDAPRPAEVDFRPAYRAMLSAAPSAPATEAGDGADAKRAIENRLTGLWSWLESISTYDWSEIVADGGITVGMVVQQEARGQRDKVQAIIEQVQRFPAIRPATPTDQVKDEMTDLTGFDLESGQNGKGGA